MLKWISVILMVVSLYACVGDETKTTIESPPKPAASVDSMAVLNELIKSSPNDGALYFRRAALKLSREDFQGAMYDAERAIGTDSLNAKFLMFKADLYDIMGKKGEHKVFLEEVIDKNPEVLDAYYELGYLYLIAENHEKAFELANEALKKDVNYAPGYFLKGLAYKDQKKYKMAVSSFQTAVEQDVEYYEAYVELGLLFALADDPLAIAYYDNAIEIDSSRIDALYNKGMYLQEHGEYEAALNAYEAILRYNPSFYNAFYNRGFVYLEYLQNYDSAAYNFGKALQINPLNHKAIYNRGLAHERNLEYSIAENDYKRALEIKPTFDLAARGLSRVQDKMKE